ncbi:MAG: STAS domain-containing protein [Gallionella sp.]|nr:STAS domain-containing protein [Gallionella sp.]MDH4285983.1 STAS domain-containing protein [Gallionella sp.]
MAITVKKRKGVAILHIGCEMTISNAAALKNELMKHIAKPCEREIDLTEVSEMDTAGIQLLLLAKREAIRQNKPLRLTNHSNAVLGVIDTYNLAAYFGDPIWITGGANK